MKLSTVTFGAIGEAGELGAERGQAKDRIALSSIVAAIFLIWLSVTADTYVFFRDYPFMTFYIPGFVITAIFIYFHILRTNRVVIIRRYCAMFMDFFSLTVMIVVGGEIMALLFAVMIRVTMGYGLRYGPRYLVAATLMALSSLAAMALLTTYWRDQPFVMLAFALMTLIVPSYAAALLKRVDEAREAAQTASLQKSRFLAQASHDLRQPVHAIGLFLATLRQTSLSTPQAIIVDRIERAQQGVGRLFRSLLDISALDSGAVTPKVEMIPVQRLLGELEHQNAAMADWTKTDIVFVQSGTTIASDPALLATMMQNLVSNALKYAPGRKVLVGCRRRGKTLSIMVADTGDGIEPAHIPRLKDDFYQVRRLGAPDIQGVGLGLGIVERLAALMGLTLEIRSRVGHGTLVAIHGLPLGASTDEPGVIVQAKPPSQPLAGLRVLLIEDDADVREATVELLESWGCVVEAHASCPVEPQPCDLIVADFDIGGGVTGADAIAHVRRTTTSPVPAIVMTGHDSRRVKSLIDADIPVLTKPVRPPELRALVNSARLASTTVALKAPLV
jgi:signal transduction histidine kinase